MKKRNQETSKTERKDNNKDNKITFPLYLKVIIIIFSIFIYVTSAFLIVVLIVSGIQLSSLKTWLILFPYILFFIFSAIWYLMINKKSFGIGYLYSFIIPSLLFVYTIVLFLLLKENFINSVIIAENFGQIISIGFGVFLLALLPEKIPSMLFASYKKIFKQKYSVILGFIIWYILLIWIFALIYGSIYFIAKGKSFLFDLPRSPGLSDFLYFSFASTLSCTSGNLIPVSTVARIFCFTETIFFLIIIGLFFSNIVNINNKK